jgi:hypothetical protein
MYTAQFVRDGISCGTVTAVTLTEMRTRLLVGELYPTDEPLIWRHMYENLVARINYVADELWDGNGSF